MTYVLPEEDLELLIKSILIATRNNKELRFLDMFLFLYQKHGDVLDACYKTLELNKLIDTNQEIYNGKKGKL